MDNEDDILIDEVIINNSFKNNIELVELGSSSDEDVLPLQNKSLLQKHQITRPIVPWFTKSVQQRLQENRRRRHNSNDYEIAEVSSEGRFLVNVGKSSSDPEVYVTEHLTNVLQPHQLGGVKFMYDNIVESIESFNKSSGTGCILAHCMGLGKTLQIITFVEIFFRYTPCKRVIIVCPVNTIQNWVNEFNKWLPETNENGETIRNFRLFLLGEAIKGLKSRTEFIREWFKEGGVLLISYDMFKLLSYGENKKKKKGVKNFDNQLNEMLVSSCAGPSTSSCTNEKFTNEEKEQIIKNAELRKELKKLLVDPGADLIVCDEGHQIKNMKTDKSASLCSVKTCRRIVLTGYPLQNNLIEYYCMVNFVKPGFLGSKKYFSQMFEKPINAALGNDACPRAIKLCKQRTHVLQQKLSGFVQRRTQHLLKKILPVSHEYVILVQKSDIQRRLYRAFVSDTNTDITDQNSSFNPLKAHNICVKILNHPDMLYNARLECCKQQLNCSKKDINGLPTNNNTFDNNTSEINSVNTAIIQQTISKPNLGNPSSLQHNNTTNWNFNSSCENSSDSLAQQNSNNSFLSNQNSLMCAKSFYNQTNLSSINFSNNNIEASNFYSNNTNNFLTHTQHNIEPAKLYQPIQQKSDYEIQFLHNVKACETVHNTKAIKFSEIIQNLEDNTDNEKFKNKSEKPSVIRDFKFTLKLPYETHNNNSNETTVFKSNSTPSTSDTTNSSKKRKQNDEVFNFVESSKKLSLNLTRDDSLEMGQTQSRIRSKSKSNQMTLSDVLLEDDERIDGSVKLEWTDLPFKYYQPGVLENGTKMALAFSIIDETTKRDEKILFFSSSINTLNVFEMFLNLRTFSTPTQPKNQWRKSINYCRFDGKTSSIERERLIKRFNAESQLYLFLISTKAGSLGINLVSANRVIIFDASWNPCDDAQAICRIYRYGQRKRTFIYRLIMNNSMEKAVFHRQIAKNSLQQKVVDQQDINANVSTRELETLFAYDEVIDSKPIRLDVDNWKIEDDLLLKVAKENLRYFADLPFLHESFMLESEDKLSEEEKFEAELLYEREMNGCSSSTSTIPRPFSSDFAFTHPAAAAFNKAFQHTNNNLSTTMNSPPLYSLDLENGSFFHPMLTNPTPYPKTLQIIEENDNNKLIDLNKIDSNKTKNMVKNSHVTLSDALNPLMDSSFNPIFNLQNYYKDNIVNPIQESNVTTTENESIITNEDLISSTNTNQRLYSVTKDGHIIISNDIFLPSIRTESEIIELKAGSLAVLCRTKNRTYLKTSDGNLLDATNTIYDFYNDNTINKINNLEQSLILNSQKRGIDTLNLAHSNKITNEVIELD